jgi:hypothetical protein
MLADTMGSTETDSVDELHKLYRDEDVHLFGVCAGTVELAAELFPMFKEQISALPRKTHGFIWEALNKAVHGHRAQHFHWDMLAPRYSVIPGQMLESQQENLLEDWRKFDTGTHMIVGTFDQFGQALLYLVGQFYDQNGNVVPGWVHPQAFPGYSTIGTGGANANFWLNYRGQHLGVGPRQSAYHAYEAKIMAARAPTVNSNLDMVIAFADKSFLLSEESSVEGAPISISELRAMFKKYGPQDTNTDLAHKKPK